MYTSFLKETNKNTLMMENKNILIVKASEDGIRLNRWFSSHFPYIHYSRIEKLLRTGQIRVDKKRSKSNLRLSTGQLIRIPPLHILDEYAATKQTPLSASLNQNLIDKCKIFLKKITLFEDEDLIAFNKPLGLAVQGGTKVGNNLDSMLESLTSYYGNRPRLVHRLDKNTSGVILVAKTASAAAWISSSFYHHETKKTYWAIVKGIPPSLEGEINFPLIKKASPLGESVTSSFEEGRNALTFYKVKEKYKSEATWLELNPITGRMHQLRVHCSLLGIPILGDGKYGVFKTSYCLESFPEVNFRKMHLHARQITLVKPNGLSLTIKAPLSSYLKETWNMLGFNMKEID